MTDKQTRLGTRMHPHVFTEDGWASVSMRIHLAELKKGWTGSRPAYINYALSERGWVVQFEEDREGYTYACHFLLSTLRSADFLGQCPLQLAEFAQELGVSAESLLVDALVYSVKFD